jgi:hypothetical protein
MVRPFSVGVPVGHVRADVNRRVHEPCEVVEQPMTNPFGQRVCGNQVERGLRAHIDLREQLVADPAQSKPIDTHHSGHQGGRLLGVQRRLLVDFVHDPPKDLLGRLTDDAEDRCADHEPDDRVRQLPSRSDARRTNQHSQGSQAVRPGVQSVG